MKRDDSEKASSFVSFSVLRRYNLIAMKKDTLLSKKQQDLASLGVGHLYASAYCFSFGCFASLVGLALALTSTRYQDFASWLAFLLVGLGLIGTGLVIFAFSFLALKKKKDPEPQPTLLCPIASLKVIRNGYWVAGALLLIGWVTLTIGVLHFPERPIEGFCLFAVSLIVLLYGRLLLLATIRDHLIFKASKELGLA